MKPMLAIIAAVVGALAGGCDEEPAAVETGVAALESTGLPTGVVCGLQYQRPGSPVFGVGCQGFASTTPKAENEICIGSVPSPAPPGFVQTADGDDRGLPSCNGFAHFRATDANSTPTTQYRLPRGTACGFKEACNNSAERCLGFDANVSCPAGWVRRVGSDMKAPSGCGFVWCEYQDPNNLCTTSACRFSNQPFGLVCGITDNDRNNKQCLGMSTATQGCPFPFHRIGFFDDGRSPGHGIGWCVLLGQPTVP
jgi:hypothetical protein